VDFRSTRLRYSEAPSIRKEPYKLGKFLEAVNFQHETKDLDIIIFEIWNKKIYSRI
jgi:hypothetical protein